MTDQEQLRVQLASSLPGWSNVDRLYEDDVDLDPGALQPVAAAQVLEDDLGDELHLDGRQRRILPQHELIDAGTHQRHDVRIRC